MSALKAVTKTALSISFSESRWRVQTDSEYLKQPITSEPETRTFFKSVDVSRDCCVNA